MLPPALTSFPRPTGPAASAERGGRCYGMSSAVPGSPPSPPNSSSSYATAVSTSFSSANSPGTTPGVNVGSPGCAGGPSLASSPGGSGISGVSTGSSYAVYSVGSAASLAAPDPHAQKAVLEQLFVRELSEGDFWYVVVAEWLEHLKKFLGITSTRKYYQHRVTTLPGPMVTRRDFAHTVDVVHEDAWRMLLQWYGLADGHKPMKLVVYRYTRGPEIEHNLNTFKLMLTTSPTEDFHNVRFSKMEKVGHVECKLRQLYAVPHHQESRLWARADPESEWRTVLARDKGIGRALEMDSDFTRPVVALELLGGEGQSWGRPPEGAVDSLMDLSTLTGESDTASILPQDYPVGLLYEHSIFDDITSAWEVDIHDQIEHLGKNFLERLHSNFAGFVQRARDYVDDREAHLRERERQITSREAVTERLASRLEEKERRLASELLACEEKIKDYEQRRQELEEKTSEMKEKAERELQEKTQELTQAKEGLEAEKENFHLELRKMAELHQVQEGRVKLDIGGHQFTTSMLTLTKEADSMLAAMFSGRHSLKLESDGSYFIDRDGTHFRHVLNYLRDGCIKEGTLPSSETVLRELLTEAEYFQLSGLADIISVMLYKPSSIKEEEGSFEGDSFE